MKKKIMSIQSPILKTGMWTVSIILFVSLIASTVSLAETSNEPENLIQMAILLDTSGSMDGLIEQAKSQLWSIVNELAQAKKNGENPFLEVALYEYGKDSIPSKEGYLRMIAPLTTDLDLISEELFKLQTNGGSEYCGQVIHSATEGLKWAKRNDILKMVFIAGNEPFTQGNFDYKNASKSAIRNGIIVNTIFCGNNKEGIDTKWKDGAMLADGKYMNIDQNKKVVHIDAPQDAEIIQLGTQLNETYISYGVEGRKKKARQETQDQLATEMAPQVIVNRSVTKSSKQYRNKSWDLVDAIEEGEMDVSKLEKEDLPKEMQEMDDEEKIEYVAGMKEKREKIQKKIKQLNTEREKYLVEARKKLVGENTLNDAIIMAIRAQAIDKNFKF